MTILVAKRGVDRPGVPVARAHRVDKENVAGADSQVRKRLMVKAGD